MEKEITREELQHLESYGRALLACLFIPPKKAENQERHIKPGSDSCKRARRRFNKNELAKWNLRETTNTSLVKACFDCPVLAQAIANLPKDLK